tara:strand:- start:6358 stop:6636 length:279 start_codon:yes stop_codon:yes gene_type:complete
MKHTIHGHQCTHCGKGMRLTKRSRLSSTTKLCFTCISNRDNLPEKYFCEGISKSTGKRCKKITMERYCAQHKNGDENNETQNSKKKNNKDVR